MEWVQRNGKLWTLHELMLQYMAAEKFANTLTASPDSAIATQIRETLSEHRRKMVDLLDELDQ